LALSIAGGTKGSTTAEARSVEVMADCVRDIGRYAWAEKCRIAELAMVADMLALMLLSRISSLLVFLWSRLNKISRVFLSRMNSEVRQCA